MKKTKKIDETEFLLRSEKNKTHLLESLKEIEESTKTGKKLPNIEKLTT